MYVTVELQDSDPTWPSGEQESDCLAAFLIAVDVAVGAGITRQSRLELLDPKEWALWVGSLPHPDDPAVRDAITALAQRQPDLLLPFQRFAFAEQSTAEGRALPDGDNAWQDTTEVVLASRNLQNSIPELSVLDRAYPCLKDNLKTLHKIVTEVASQQVRLLLTT